MTNVLTRFLTTCWSYGLPKRLTILIYHRVLPEYDPMQFYEIEAKTFYQQMKWLKAFTHVLPLQEGLQRLQQGTLPDRAVAITFDDGYAPDCLTAQQILQQLDMKASFYVTTAFEADGMQWNDKVIEAVRHWPSDMLDFSHRGLPAFPCKSIEERAVAALKMCDAIKYLPWQTRCEIVDELVQRAQIRQQRVLLNPEEVLQLSRSGMEIGGHSHRHPILQCLSEQDAYQEIAQCKQVLDSLLDRPIESFAYPNGKFSQDFSPSHMDMLQQMGFKYALSTNWGVVSKHSNLWRLPRFTPWDNKQAMYMLRLMRNHFYS